MGRTLSGGIKSHALALMENNQMCDLRFGTVTSVSPLKVQITPQMILPASLLIVPKQLTDYTVSVSMNWTTESAGSHSHGYSGTDSRGDSHSSTTDPAGTHTHKLVSGKSKTITIHNALKVGDKVALLRKTGGQSYFILDRV